MTNVRKIIIILLIIIIILGLFVWGYSSSGAESIKDYWTSVKETITSLFTPKSKPADEVNTVYLGEIDEESLIVDLNEITEDLFKDVPWLLSMESLSPCDEERLYYDAVCLPMDVIKKDDGSYDLEHLFKQVKEQILRNPIYGDMIIRGMSDIKLRNGKTLGELNPWMQEFITKSDAAYNAPTDAHPYGAEYWCARYENYEDIYVSNEYRHYANALCVLLNRLTMVGVREWETTENWRLNTSNDDMALRRTEVAPYQESLPALVLGHQDKGQDFEFLIGLNETDKRYEEYGDHPTTPPDSPDGPPPGPTPTPSPKKNPKLDPPSLPGNGGNNPSDGDGRVQPTEPPRPSAQPEVTPTPTPTPNPPPDGTSYQHVDNGTPPATPPLTVPTDTTISDGHGGGTPITQEPVNDGAIPEPD